MPNPYAQFDEGSTAVEENLYAQFDEGKSDSDQPDYGALWESLPPPDLPEPGQAYIPESLRPIPRSAEELAQQNFQDQASLSEQFPGFSTPGLKTSDDPLELPSIAPSREQMKKFLTLSNPLAGPVTPETDPTGLVPPPDWLTDVATGAVRGADVIGRGAIEFATTPSGALQLASLATPLAPITLGKFTYDMSKMAVKAAQKAGTKFGEGDILGGAEASTESVLAALGAKSSAGGSLKSLAQQVKKGGSDARSQQEATTVHGDVLTQPGEGPGKVPIEEGRARVQPRSDALAEETQVLLKENSGGMEYDVVDTPESKTGHGEPLKFNIETGRVEVMSGDFERWVSDLKAKYSPAEVARRIESGFMEEGIHAATPVEDILPFRESLSKFERWVYDRNYLKGSTPESLGPNAEFKLGYENVRNRIEQALKLDRNDFIELAGTQKWTAQSLDALAQIVGKMRSKLNAELKTKQVAILDRVLDNLKAAREARAGAPAPPDPDTLSEDEKAAFQKDIDEATGQTEEPAAESAATEPTLRPTTAEHVKILESDPEIGTDPDKQALLGALKDQLEFEGRGRSPAMRRFLDKKVNEDNGPEIARLLGVRWDGVQDFGLGPGKRLIAMTFQEGPAQGATFYVKEGATGAELQAKAAAKLADFSEAESGPAMRRQKIDSEDYDAWIRKGARLRATAQNETEVEPRSQAARDAWDRLADHNESRPDFLSLVNQPREGEAIGPGTGPAMRRRTKMEDLAKLRELRIAAAEGEEPPKLKGAGPAHEPVPPSERLSATEAGAQARISGADLEKSMASHLAGEIKKRLIVKTRERTFSDFKRWANKNMPGASFETIQRMWNNPQARDKFTKSQGPARISYTRPSFDAFSDWARRNMEGIRPSQLRDMWEDKVWSELMKAKPERLEAWRAAFGLESKYGSKKIHQPENIEALVLQDLVETRGFLKTESLELALQSLKQGKATQSARERYRNKLIVAIAQKLIGESINERPELSRSEITTDDVDFSNEKTKYGPYRELSRAEIDDPQVLNRVLRDQARGSSADPESASRRLVAAVDSQGRVELLSTYNDAGVQRVTDPAGPKTKGRPHRELNAAFVRQYRPFASILIADPVQGFRQRFDSVSEFMDKIGEEASQRSRISDIGFPGEGPVEGFQAEGTEGINEGGMFMGPGARSVRAEMGMSIGAVEAGESISITDAEAGAVLGHIIGEVGKIDSVTDVDNALKSLREETNPQVLSGYRKLARELQRQNPDLDVQQLWEKLADQIYENDKQSKTGDEFIARTLQQAGVKPAGEAAPASGATTGREITVQPRAPIERAGGPPLRGITGQAAQITAAEASARASARAEALAGSIAETPAEEHPSIREFKRTQQMAREAEAEAAQEGPAMRRMREKSEDAFSKIKGVVASHLARRGTEQNIVAWRDAADTTANNDSRQAGNSIKVQSANPLVRAAAKAVIASGRDQAKLQGFFRLIDNGMNQAQRLIARGDMADRRAGRAWLKASERLRSEVEYANSHWNEPELLATASTVSREMRREFNFETANGINLRLAPNYIPGRYDAEFFNDNAIMFGEQRILGRNYRKPKQFANYYEAISDGPYIPKSYDAAELVEHRVRQGRREINKKLWLESLKNVDDPDTGAPIVANPVKRQGQWVSPSPEYELFTLGPGKDPVAVRQGYKDLLDVLTMQSTVSKTPVGKAALAATGILKHGVILILDTFHPGRLGEYALALHGAKTGYRGAFSALEYRDADLPRAVAHEYITQEAADWAAQPVNVRLPSGAAGTLTRRQVLEHVMSEGLNVGRIQDAIHQDLVRNWPVVGKLNHWTFDKFTRGLMADGAVREFERLNQATPGVSMDKLARKVAKDLNVYYGSIGRQGWIRNPTIRDFAQIVFLAPQWVEGLIRKEVTGAKQLATPPVRLARGESAALGTIGRGMGRGLIAYFLLTQVANLITRRQTTFQNEEKGHKLDAWIPTGADSGFWLSPLSVFGEITHDVLRYGESKPNTYEAIRNIGQNKLGPWGRLAWVLATREDAYGRRFTTSGQVLGEAAKQMAPAPISLGVPIRSAAHAVAPSMVKAAPPGALPRQLLAAGGIKVQPGASKFRQLQNVVDDKLRKSDDPQENAIWNRRLMERGVFASDYTPIRQALIAGDIATAKLEYQKLLQIKGNSKMDAETMIDNAMNPDKGTITGLSKELEGDIEDRMTPAERRILESARAEQERLYDLFSARVAR
jgi:hypothetical protein